MSKVVATDASTQNGQVTLTDMNTGGSTVVNNSDTDAIRDAFQNGIPANDQEN